jgi:hypothetical protein
MKPNATHGSGAEAPIAPRHEDHGILAALEGIVSADINKAWTDHVRQKMQFNEESV